MSHIRDSAPTQTRAEESARTGEPPEPSVGEIGGSNSPAPQAYPTDAKVREKERRKAEKAAGVEHKVKKRKKIIEDHHDDCGEDLSSLHDGTSSANIYPCDYDTDGALSDDDRNECVCLAYGS